jgi:hypothetical protein
VVFGKDLFRDMQSRIEPHAHTIEVPLDQGWSFLSVLSYAAFEPRFFYLSHRDCFDIRIYSEFDRLIAK